MLLHHVIWQLGIGLPILHAGLVGVDVEGKEGLAYVISLVQLIC
jgi:hypothetical protein